MVSADDTCSFVFDVDLNSLPILRTNRLAFKDRLALRGDGLSGGGTACSGRDSSAWCAGSSCSSVGDCEGDCEDGNGCCEKDAPVVPVPFTAVEKVEGVPVDP